MEIVYQPIGIIHSPWTTLAGMPIQPAGAQGVRGRVVLDPAYGEGLRDIEGFSHLILLYHLHRSQGYALTLTPFLDTVPHGVFATRAPRRPNAIGLSVVRLLAVAGTELEIDNVDILDGTPLLDIKPYVPAFRSDGEVRTGWLEQAAARVAMWRPSRSTATRSQSAKISSMRCEM